MAIIGLLIVFVVAAVIFFSMISDQIFFKHVKSEKKVIKIDKTLDKAANKYITIRVNRYLIKIMIHGVMHQMLKLKQLWIVVNSLIMINKISILDLSKYQGIDKTELNVFYLIDQYY